MSDPNQPSTPPGWYPDGQGGQRWWDGSQWTEHTQPPGGGGGAPAAPAAPASPAPAAPAAPQAPSVPGHDLPTQVAPNRAASYPGQPGQPGQPQQPAAPQAPQGAYGAPAGQAAYGQPAAGGYGQQPPFGGFPPAGGSGGGGKGKLIAIIGGAVGALILVVILLFVIFSVVGGGSPEDVADDYLEASVEQDYGRVCELVREKDREDAFKELDVDDCGDVDDAVREDEDFDEEELEEYLEDFEVSYEIGDVKEKEKTAEVEFTSKTEYKGDDEDLAEYVDGEEEDGVIYLVKEDGDWKVDADKSDSVG